MEVVIKRDYDQMSRAAAQLVVDVLNTKPNAVLGMATGSTPLGLYQELVRLHQAGHVDFSRVTTFNLDEYVGLPANHPQSYHYFMDEHFFRHVNIPRHNINIPSGTTSNYPAFCQWYEGRIAECGGIDLQILGIGSDGHIAFNEPGSSLSSRTRLKTLSKQTIDDNARFFDAREDVPVYAITMGVGTILDARKLVLVASGKHKAKAIAQAVEGPVTSMVTASALQLHRDAIVITDQEAAADLTFAKLPAARQDELIAAYYSADRGIGYTLARTNIHSCDFSSESYTYVTEGDKDLTSFSIAHDLRYRIPLIKRALAATGNRLKLFASPWSPPAYMKDNNDMLHGGHLRPEFYRAWALYYTKFIKSYRQAGVPIWGITVQNEPMATQTWESCVYQATDERDVGKNHLGPAMVEQGLRDVHVMVWDHK